MLIPAALLASTSESVSPRMVSSTPQTTNTPPMMRRRSNRLAARSARDVVSEDTVSSLPEHDRQDQGADEHEPAEDRRGVRRGDAVVRVGHAVDQALQLLDRLGLRAQGDEPDRDRKSP